jgi:predicted ATP-binding protein involved in virulence
MYIHKINIENHGCIDNLELVPDFVDNMPKPIVFVGQNGSGKTLLLANIVNSVIEFKRKKYPQLKEVTGSNYFKVGSHNQIQDGKNHSYFYIQYKTEDGSKQFEFTDIMAKNTEVMKSQNIENYKNFNPYDPNYLESGYFNFLNGEITSEFEDSIFLYFPVSRYYEPAWHNPQNSTLGFEFNMNFIGQSNQNMIKSNVLKEIEKWIMDLLLDKYIYEEIRTDAIIYEPNKNIHRPGKEFKGYAGKNTNTLNQINNILTQIYSCKFENIEFARIGVSQKEGRMLSVIIKEKDNPIEIKVAPTFSHLSSGEAMLISLFGSLLMEYDKLNTDGARTLADVKGIVLIDEIDLNLHIKFAKEIVPKLIRLFPNVQFVITTHSPFLTLGMQEEFKNEWQLIDTPSGMTIENDDFGEMKIAYNSFIDNHQELREKYKIVTTEIEKITKTLIITEGKTDWRHFDNALKTFQSNSLFNDLDIQFLPYDDIKMSETELNTLLQQFAKVPQPRKIIGIFDRDSSMTDKYGKQRINKLAENVYGICIPVPEFRKEHRGICVELMYKDEDLFSTDENDRRLFLSSEFNDKTGRHNENPLISIRNADKINKKTEINNSIIIDNGIYDENGNSIALSKIDFANYVFNHKEGFSDFDLSAFEELFNILEEIELQNLNSEHKITVQI